MTHDIQWTDIAGAVGGIAAAVGVLGGALVAIFYGRKASAMVTAKVHLIDGEYILQARPSISAAGLFRLQFDGEEGVTIRATEVVRTESGLVDGQFWDGESVFANHFVEGGETLVTTVLFLLGPAFPGLVGWRVSFGVTVQRTIVRSSGWSWADQTFVPVPTTSMESVEGMGRD